MSKPPIYQEALGIATGDIITTSYGTGPYIVKRISGPSYVHQSISALVIWPYPVISLVLADTDPAYIRGLSCSAYINNIHREPDGRYLTDGGDEITVQRPASVTPGQMSLFAALISPYQFQPGVDYHAGDKRVWHCPYCGRDFNAEKQGICGPACPRCSGRFNKITIPVIMMGNGQPGNSYVRGLNA